MTSNMSSVIKNIYNSGAGIQNRSSKHFEKLTFYQQLDEIYPPVKLKTLNTIDLNQRKIFSFMLKSDQISEIKNGIELTNEGHKYTKRLCLRLGDYKSSESNIADDLPVNLTIFINSRAVQLPGVNPKNSNTANIQRIGKPIDITLLCSLETNRSNKVDIRWKNIDAKKNYHFGIFLFKMLNVERLIKKLKDNRVSNPSISRNMIIDQLKSVNSSDLQIEANTLRISLKCPLMKSRLKLPGRSIHCKHIQCFDIENYLMMNEKKGRWLCPICDVKATYDYLLIDGLFQELLSSCRNDEIVFNHDGSCLQNDDAEINNDSGIQNENEIIDVEEFEVICLSGNEDEECQIIGSMSQFDKLKDDLYKEYDAVKDLINQAPGSITPPKTP